MVVVVFGVPRDEDREAETICRLMLSICTRGLYLGGRHHGRESHVRRGTDLVQCLGVPELTLGCVTTRVDGTSRERARDTR